jgi:nucleoside-diphosphate kinase
VENTSVEQTLVLIKPDALKLSLTGYVLTQLSESHTGLRFAGLKVVHVSRMLAAEHYAEHNGKPFYPGLLDYIMGKKHYADTPQKRRVIAIAYNGEDAIKKIRAICGPTDPHEAREKAPSTIRALGTLIMVKDAQGNLVRERIDNLIHASANLGDAEREIKLWFKPTDIMPYMQQYPTERCEEHYYVKNGKLSLNYVAESVCLFAPGDVVWTADLEALRAIAKGQPSKTSLNGIAAKYLINTAREE